MTALLTARTPTAPAASLILLRQVGGR
jgi:hypothetical protein